MNDFLLTELARHWMSRVVRDAETSRLLGAAESTDPAPPRRRRRRASGDR